MRVLCPGRLAAAALVLGLAVTPVEAAKTDVIILRNGDRLTCEIKSLSQGRLQVDTDDAGTIGIEWDKLARVTAPRVFEIETSSGEIFVGVITSPEDARLAVTDSAGNTTTHDFMNVVRMSPIGRSFFHRIDGALDLGFSFTQSSGVAQLTIHGNATFRRPAFEVNTILSSYVTRQREGDDTDRQSLQFGYIKRLPKRWLVGGLGIYERNPDLGFDQRETAAAIVGQRLIQSNRGDMSYGGGLAVSWEKPLTGEPSTNVDALAWFSGSFFTYDSPKTNLSYSALAYPGLSDAGRIRTEINLSVSREIVHNFTVGVSGYHSYDNRPPTEGVASNDYGTTLSIGWKF
jgi:hypothetical protein